jgi:O-succinylbenzoate synthase
VTLPLRSPFVTSVENEVDRPVLIVEIEADGLRGYGEVAINDNPWFFCETRSTALVMMREFLIPMALAADFEAPDDVPGVFDRVRGWTFAKAGLEGAILDLLAKRAGVPLYRFLGGDRNRVPCGTSIGMENTVAAMMERVDAAVAADTSRVKVKITPGFDIEVLETIRSRYPDIPLMADANEAYGSADMDLLASFDRFGLLMLEQPFPDKRLDLHADLAAMIETPICLDDAIHDLETARLAHRIGALGILNVKAPRMGGWIRSRDAAAWCADNGIPAFVGGLVDTGIGKSFNLALATCRGLELPADATPSAHHFTNDLVDPPITMADGFWTPPEKPGIGVEVDRDRLISDITLEVLAN